VDCDITCRAWRSRSTFRLRWPLCFGNLSLNAGSSASAAASSARRRMWL